MSAKVLHIIIKPFQKVISRGLYNLMWSKFIIKKNHIIMNNDCGRNSYLLSTYLFIYKAVLLHIKNNIFN